jgi:two-component system, OmpR family, sensor kinase
MRRSLQKRLSLMLAGALLVAALFAGVASFVLAYAEAKEFQDDMLRQVANLISISGDRINQANEAGGASTALADPESRLLVYRLPSDPAPPWFSVKLNTGFHTIPGQDGQLRVYVHKDGQGQVSVVAQPTDARDEIAIGSALRTLLPLVLVFPLLAFLIIRIVRIEFAPVHTLAHHLDEQPAGQPEALPDRQVPDEILPFVQAINRLLGRVNELVGQQRRFIADAAHELRSPLTALSVQAQNLEQAKSMEDMRERAVPLRAGIERAKKLTEQLLSLARTQASQPENDEIEVSRLLRELVAEFIPMAEAKQIDLGMEVSETLILPATPDALRLIIRNAMENALKYAPPDSEVTVHIYREGNEAIIDVIDQGSGIPETERERVFEPFYRMEGASGEGSGLGLAIAREAAVSLSGSVSLIAHSSGKGTIFRYRQNLQPHSSA